MKSIQAATLLALIGTLPVAANPIFPNSIVSNELEFIQASDPHVFRCLGFLKTAKQEMPNKLSNDLFHQAHVFIAQFEDGTSVDLFASTNLGTPPQAEKILLKIAPSLGRLPTFMRKDLSHVIIHKGDETAFAEDKGRFFVMYDQNIQDRIQTHDIDETVFHESVHATLDVPYASSRKWQTAQKSDGGFITQYGQRNPNREDMAESALFAWAMSQYPGRLPTKIEQAVKNRMPSRLAFFDTIFDQARPQFQRVSSAKDCS